MQHPRLSPGARGNSGRSLGSDVSEYTDALHAFQQVNDATWQHLGDVPARIPGGGDLGPGIVGALRGEHFPPPPIREVSS